MSRLQFLVLICIGAAAGPASSAELAWPAGIYSHYSNEEPLRDVLESVASSQGIPVVISDKVDDIISVSFTELEPGEIFHRLTNAYKLTHYYDGNALFIYRLDEVKSSMIKLSSMSAIEFRQSLEQLGVFDERFPWNVEHKQKLVFFSGPPRFVSLVNEMAKRMDIQKPPLSDTVYTWQDRYGVTHYSSAPPALPPAAPVQTIAIQKSAVTESTPKVDVPASN